MKGLSTSGLISYKDHGLSNPKILLKASHIILAKHSNNCPHVPPTTGKVKVFSPPGPCDLPPSPATLHPPSSLCFNDTGWSPVPLTHIKHALCLLFPLLRTPLPKYPYACLPLLYIITIQCQLIKDNP